MESEIRSSRLWALLRLWFGAMLFPHRMRLNEDGMATTKVRYALLPWVRTEEHASFGRIASLVHDKGIVWDRVIVETTGGSNNLAIAGVAKGAARAFVAAVNARLEAKR
jgi:hypothetical protein